MASPWKLLARLVSPRRQQRQEHGSTDDVKPDASAIAKATDTAANNDLNAADRPAGEKAGFSPSFRRGVSRPGSCRRGGEQC